MRYFASNNSEKLPFDQFYDCQVHPRSVYKNIFFSLTEIFHLQLDFGSFLSTSLGILCFSKLSTLLSSALAA